MDGAGHLVPLLEGDYACRQDIPPVYALNGAVYVAEVSWLLKKQVFVSDETLAYIMPKDRSIDIDTEADLVFVNQLLSNQIRKEMHKEK